MRDRGDFLWFHFGRLSEVGGTCGCGRQVKRSSLTAFWEQHPETEQPLKEWFLTAKSAGWTCMDDVMKSYPKAKILNGERARFEICGGNYRLIVSFKFSANIAFVKFIGTHAEYDRINALTIDRY